MYLQERASPTEMGIGPAAAGAAIITNYFLVLVFCAFLSFVFAFLLRRLMALFHVESIWPWVLTGTALALPMAWGVRGAAHASDVVGLQGPGHEIAVFLFLGVRGIAEHHVWLGLPVAALTSIVLFLINRAFNQQTKE
jgi:hypothetical protein